MIPQFPEFKNLELSDKEDVENFTKKFPPYSDFNFVSMWSWDVKGDIRISQLNDSLIVKFTDYITGEPVYSFMGKIEVNDTVQKLLSFSKEQGIGLRLSLVPEESVKELDSTKFVTSEEREHFDYIYDLTEVSVLKGLRFSKKRNVINKLTKTYTVSVSILDTTNPQTKFDIKKVNLLWLEQKAKKDAYFEVKNEFIAIDKFFDGNFSDNIITIGVFVNDVMVGYTITEVILDGYAISHFTKANFMYKGVYDYLMRENAKLLLEKGVHFLNYEQDLGLPGLRTSKEGFSTGIFLKQYRVMLK